MYIEAGGWPTNDHMFGVVEFQRKKKNVGGGEFFWLMLDSFYNKNSNGLCNYKRKDAGVSKLWLF